MVILLGSGAGGNAVRDIADGVAAWIEAGTRLALATVTQTWKSAPRPPGASMAVADNGEVLGSVSGGCVEAAVYEVAQEVLSTGVPVVATYGVSDGDAFAVGLSCGGIIDVLVEPVDSGHFPELGEVLTRIRTSRPVATATVVSTEPGHGHLIITPDHRLGSLGNPDLDARVAERAEGLLAQGQTAVLHLGAHGEQLADDISVFVQAFAPPPRMIVFGAIDFAGAVARIGKFLGYHVTLCDARAVFATRKRFPEVDELVVDWPHRYLEGITVDDRTVICVLTHDPKFDVPLLERALVTPARYIGAMGSRRTHDDRMTRLREAGVSESALARLASPIGLDLGARTPEETAVSIAAEIIELTWGGSGSRLSEVDLAIHHPPLSSESSVSAAGP